MDPIYLDYNATTPIDPAVAQAMLPYIHELFGNPSSGHIYGQRTKSAVDSARRQISTLLGCLDEELIFTSGGTEANNYAIKGVVGAYKNKGNHIITSSVEHPAVIEVCRFLESQGCRVTYLPVDEYGLANPQQVHDAITPQTILVTIMHANNEVGTIEPVREIADIAHQRGILVHTDCAQSIGKIPVTVDQRPGKEGVGGIRHPVDQFITGILVSRDLQFLAPQPGGFAISAGTRVASCRHSALVKNTPVGYATTTWLEAYLGKESLESVIVILAPLFKRMMMTASTLDSQAEE